MGWQKWLISDATSVQPILSLNGLDGYPEADGFRVYQCLKCCAVGTKNLAESTDTQEPVMRCTKCGSWMFADKECHTCALIMTK
jgi:DNA-directed RNA polymerase subunit RPC12/RpoP